MQGLKPLLYPALYFSKSQFYFNHTLLKAVKHAVNKLEKDLELLIILEKGKIQPVNSLLLNMGTEACTILMFRAEKLGLYIVPVINCNLQNIK